MSSNLHEKQQQAVYHHGNLLIVAGPGAGKTYVLTEKLAYILHNRDIMEDNILVITFTNKAANEIKMRISKKIDTDIKWVGTFHNICNRILHMHTKLLNIQEFSIIDYQDQIAFFRSYTENPKDMLETIIYNKENQINLNDKIMLQYNNYLMQNNKMDFADLMTKTVELFETHQNILEIYQNKFKIILIDEYQDTNSVQYKFIKLIGSKSEVCCVGDDDQSIYEWRGANIDNFKHFVRDFNASIVMLEKNYRSTQNIIDLACNIVKNNKNRMNKSIIADTKNSGSITFKNFDTQYTEAKYIAQIISANHTLHTAILVRTTAQMQCISQALKDYKIKHHVHGTMNLYEREEIKNMMAYLRLVYRNDNDDFIRIVNVPKKGIGKATISKLYDLHNDLLHAANLSNNNVLKAFYANIMKWRGYNTSLEILARKIFIESEYHSVLDNHEYVNEFISSLYNINSLEALCNHHGGVHAHINVMTIHAAKGLEFDRVFIPGLSEGILPISEQNLEEERRIIYTAITRAKHTIYLLSCNSCYISSRMVKTNESRFIREMNADIVNTVYHKQYKYGRVLSRNSKTITVEFPVYGIKTILKEFLS